MPIVRFEPFHVLLCAGSDQREDLELMRLIDEQYLKTPTNASSG